MRSAAHQSDKPTKPLLEYAGKPWSREDEEALCRIFAEGYTGDEMCVHFKRSTGAIAERLVKLGKIGAQDEFRRN